MCLLKMSVYCANLIDFMEISLKLQSDSMISDSLRLQLFVTVMISTHKQNALAVKMNS